MLHIKPTLKSKTTSHLLTYLFICTVLSFPLSAFASPTWVAFDPSYPEGSPPEITVLEHDTEHTTLEINIPGMWVEEVYEVGEVFQKLEIPEYQTLLDIGRPALPAIGEFVGYLEPSENRIYFEDLETLVLDDYLVYPAQTPQTDQPSSLNLPFDYDWEFYREDTWYPEERANVSDTKILREVCIAHTGIVPFEYNPAQRELVVNYRIMVDVLHHPGGLGLDGWMIPLGADPTFVNMYRGLIVNYEWLGLGEFDTTSGYDYLIVTHSEFLNNANMMADHLITQGYSVYVQVKDTTDWLQIYNTIKDFYNNNFNDYVLLFGDVGYIPIPIRQWKNPVTGYYIDIPSDMVYAGITGDDVFPEVAVGRLSVNNVTQARIQVRKNIFHYLYWDPDKELRCLLVSHKEQDYVDCKNDVYDFDYQMYQPFFVKVYGNWDWVYNKHIIYFLEYGERIVNYRGHGSKVAWADWNTYGQNFDFSCIDDTRLGNNRPAVFSITCLTGDITYGECFCEHWMNVPEGAVGAVGATLTTYATPNNVFDKQLFRVLYGYNAGGQIHYEGHLGLLHNWAKLEMLKDYYGLGGWEYAIHTLLTYLLLGDPSLWILPLDDKYISSEEGGSIISKNENSIQDFLEQPTLTLYPNPVYDILSLDINTKQPGEVELKLYDISGRLVTTKNYMLGIGGSSHAFDLTNLGLESGVYIIHLTAPGLSESRKIVFAP